MSWACAPSARNLLCEQVVGRGLRRMSYAVNAEGRFSPEYAEVYGVPFSFIPCSGATKDPKLGPLPTRVRALENRIDCEVSFPRLLGYRYDVADKPLTATFTDQSRLALSTADIPTRTENAPIVGEFSIHTLDDLKPPPTQRSRLPVSLSSRWKSISGRMATYGLIDPKSTSLTAR